MARRYFLRFTVVAYLFFLVAWPLFLVGKNALANGFDDIRAILIDPDTAHALRLTVLIALLAVVINTVFGVGISLLLVRYDFRGKRLLSPLLDLPLSVSPIVVGLALILVYGGRSGWFGPTLENAGLQIHTRPAGAGDIAGTVVRVTRVGFEIRIEVATSAGQTVTVTLTRNEFLALGIAIDTQVHLRVAPHSPTTPASVPGQTPASSPSLVS